MLFPCIPILGVFAFSFFWFKRYYGMSHLGFAMKLSEIAQFNTTSWYMTQFYNDEHS